MNPIISQENLGHRLAELRKYRGFSQEEVARQIQISRPSLAQVEAGKRQLNVPEFQKLSQVLGFSLDSFLDKSYALKEPIVAYQVATKTTAVRDNEPIFKADKFENVLLYLLEKYAAKPNSNQSVVQVLLYFCDFNCYERYEEQLTGATYRKVVHGPLPEELDAMLERMLETASLQRIKVQQKQTQIRYLPLRKADLTQLKASEKEVIDQVLEQFSDWSASALIAYAHKDMPWIATQSNAVINYELSFYREAPFSVRNYDEV